MSASLHHLFRAFRLPGRASAWPPAGVVHARATWQGDRIVLVPMPAPVVARAPGETPRRLLVSALVTTTALGGPVRAQTAPAPTDAGSVRQQFERPLDLRLPGTAQRPPPAAAAPPARVSATSGASEHIAVRGYRFTGNTLIDETVLADAVAPFTGPAVSFDRLQAAADAVAARYRQDGWIVRCDLPEQEVADGIVTLRVVEARFAGVRFESPQPLRVMPRLIAGVLEHGQPRGAPLRADALDRALLLAEDLPGVTLSGTLAPGVADGETELVVRAVDGPLVSGDVAWDNTGSRQTGAERVSANVALASPTGRGELVTANAAKARGSEFVRVAAAMPLGGDGLKLGVNASGLRYEVLTMAGARGRSDSLGLDLSWPVVRTRDATVVVAAAAEHKTFVNETAFGVSSDYAVRTATASATATRYDDLAGGGLTSAQAAVVVGRVAGASPLPPAAAPREYAKLRGTVSRQQNLTARQSLSVSVSAQVSSQALDSSEKFYLGGIYGVRAYPAGEIGGARGAVANVDWRLRLPHGVVAGVFHDVGRVSSPGEAAATVRGSGASVAWQGPAGVSARLTVARRHGENPRPTATGTDADGTRTLNRVWASVSWRF